MKRIYIVAGGTAGHINAALALGEKYQTQYEVEYITGKRYLDYQLFKDSKVQHIDSKALRGVNLFQFFLNIIGNIFVFIKLIDFLRKKQPHFLIGASGYVCGPALLAGKFLGKRVFILEQNASLGLTNKILSKIATIIFTKFENTKGLSAAKKVIVSGNPIRSTIKFSQQKIEIGEKRVLVYGGSLGSNQINQAIRAFIKIKKENIKILHQVGKNNTEKIILDDYKEVEYIDDMQEAYDWANIIIARSGASTVSELEVVCKPSILIPFPNHADNHQVYNAEELKKKSDFQVFVLDKNLKGMDLAKKIEETINSIELKMNIKRDTVMVDPFVIISKAIKKCME